MEDLLILCNFVYICYVGGDFVYIIFFLELYLIYCCFLVKNKNLLWLLVVLNFFLSIYIQFWVCVFFYYFFIRNCLGLRNLIFMVFFDADRLILSFFQIMQ